MKGMHAVNMLIYTNCTTRFPGLSRALHHRSLPTLSLTMYKQATIIMTLECQHSVCYMVSHHILQIMCAVVCHPVC